MSWWRHQMERFVALLALCEGNPPVTHRSPVDSPHKGQWRGVLMFSLICASTNNCANNRDAGDLRRHRTHQDVTVMSLERRIRWNIWFISISSAAVYAMTFTRTVWPWFPIYSACLQWNGRHGREKEFIGFVTWRVIRFNAKPLTCFRRL